MVVYTIEQSWEVGLRSTYRRCRFWQKKKIIFSIEVHFDLGGYVNKQICRIWGTENRTHTLKSRRNPKRVTLWHSFLVQRHEFLFTNGTALSATQPKLHSMFCILFLKIALSAAELMSFGHLGAAIKLRWTIICGLPSKVSVTQLSQRQLTL